ncbi:MAG: translation elongation factor G [SAR202 cluster bacterium Io17-Chloro-G3]|nr:MAG: translation elongation factor G [SAR202 cluster bacterium Io17-Chloro-G3]
MAQMDTQHFRNIALVAHSGAGKTTVTEAVLMATQTISRLGKVDDGTTTSDYEPEEIRRHSSISTSLAPCVWGSNKINVIDTPGYPDFIGEVISGLKAADAAILVVAAHAGVEVGTEEAWRLCQELGLPVIIFINKMDRENADFGQALKHVQDSFGSKCTAIQIANGSEQNFLGMIDLKNLPAEVPSAVSGEVEQLRDRLVEAVAETDENLTMKFLEGEEISQEELTAALRQAVLSGKFVPVLGGSAANSVGITELLNAVVDLLPSPLEARLPNFESEGKEIELSTNSDGPLAALVFKTTADPYVGTLSYLRVFSGTLKSDSQVWNSTKGLGERIGQLFALRGKNQEQRDSLITGDIGAVAKLSSTSTGDTLAQRESSGILEPLSFPDTIYTSAISPKGKADFDKMSSALARLVEEDPTLRLRRDLDTAETLLDAMGDTHIDVAVEKAKRKFGVDLEAALPKVSYKETIKASTKVEYKHKKQSGGHGQYAHVMIRLEPLPRGGGFEFGSKVVGGNVPKEYIPAVEKGVGKSLQGGALAGYPIVDIKAILYDGSSHPVDSSGMSFEIAGSFALRQGVADASPILLEPIVRLRVTVPDSFTGEVMGDLNGKRARILGMTPQSGVTLIEAEVPQAEVLRYSADLRSVSQGRGRFSVEFVRYDEVPAHLTQKIVDETKNETSSKG